MPKISKYQFDSETWVVTVDDTEYCICATYLEQLGTPEERANIIMKALSRHFAAESMAAYLLRKKKGE
jgi:hypothetical protein